MSTARALGVLAIVVIVVAPYLALTAMLGVRDYWVGFLFLFQWSMMEEMQWQRLPRSTLGAVMGIAIACAVIWLAPVIGAAHAQWAQIAIIAVSVFLLIRQIAGLFVNGATMLFLTAMTIPKVAQDAQPVDFFIGMAAGVLYFGGLSIGAAGISRLSAMNKARMPA